MMSLLSTAEPCRSPTTSAFGEVQGLRALCQASGDLLVSLSVPGDDPSLLRDRVDASLRGIRDAVVALDHQLFEPPRTAGTVEVGALLAFLIDLGVGVRAGMAVPEIRLGGNELLVDLARFTQWAADAGPVAR